MRRFGYLHDRLFWMALSVYTVNRLIVRPYFSGYIRVHQHWLWGFLHSHLDDLLLIPAALPVALWIQRLLNLRRQDEPPGWREMFLHLVVWSLMSKVIGPLYLHLGVADPWDVVCFAAGGIAACLWWNRKPLHFPRPLHEL